jgi:hypothetical protein
MWGVRESRLLAHTQAWTQSQAVIVWGVRPPRAFRPSHPTPSPTPSATGHSKLISPGNPWCLAGNPPYKLIKGTAGQTYRLANLQYSPEESPKIGKEKTPSSPL